MMDGFRDRKDSSGRYYFAIPVGDSSKEDEAQQLDKIVFKDWLSQHNFTSEELLWLLDYSCRDDYGLGIKYVSAWAGIHYFAGRKNNWSKNIKIRFSHGRKEMHDWQVIFQNILKENL